MQADSYTEIETNLGEKIKSVESVAGGCISNSFIVTTDTNQYFSKTLDHQEVFLKEANGLRELAKPNVIKTPEVIHASNNLLILEYIPTGRKDKYFFTRFGEQFARLHQYHSDHFGFYEDNFIGSTPQINTQIKYNSSVEEKDWVEFYYTNRLLYQYKLAEKNHYVTPEMVKLMSQLERKIETILADNVEQPSLLHGDCWAGNYLVTDKGEPCLIDPAVYYGHREADLAMTKLFGGFDAEFYRAYDATYPLQEGYQYREGIYKLYHVLNHLNLFGSGYYSQAIRILQFYCC